jgi:3-hydroxyacyl-CoA dehydrogenase
MGNINAVTNLSVESEIGIVSVNSPPVNAMSTLVRTGLFKAFATVLDDPAAKAVVLICDGRTFFAGADISELGKPDEGPNFAQVLTAVENAAKPVIAAIHGTALGGGFELALACHYRVAVPSAKVGLPEVHLGVLPGAGGTQRLPRIVGVEVALDLITSGRTITAVEAQERGAVDALAREGELRAQAIEFARRLIRDAKPLQRVRDLTDKIEAARARPAIFSEFRRANARRFRGFKAPECIVRCIEAAVNLPFEQGLELETALFDQLVVGPESEAQRYAFFAEREVTKVPGVDTKTPALSIDSVAVVGGGAMGCAIATAFAKAGISVSLVEARQEALDRAVATIGSSLSRGTSGERMRLLEPTLDLTAVGHSDLIVEAVTENLPMKTELFGRLDQIAKPGAVLATCTSSPDVDAIAAGTRRPASVVGLHFFSPLQDIRLLEIVRGARTANEVIATSVQLARRIGKLAVVSRAAEGFIARRAMKACFQAANELVSEGSSPLEIDEAMVQFGFPSGPFSMAGSVRPAQQYGNQPIRRSQSDLTERLLYPVVNESARILEEGIAIRASDIDVALIHAYGWPVYTGGPLFWARKVGLPRIVRSLRAMQETSESLYTPASVLERMATDGGELRS